MRVRTAFASAARQRRSRRAPRGRTVRSSAWTSRISRFANAAFRPDHTMLGNGCVWPPREILRRLRTRPARMPDRFRTAVAKRSDVAGTRLRQNRPSQHHYGDGEIDHKAGNINQSRDERGRASSGSNPSRRAGKATGYRTETPTRPLRSVIARQSGRPDLVRSVVLPKRPTR